MRKGVPSYIINTVVIEFTNLQDRHAPASSGSTAFVITAVIFILIPVAIVLIGLSSQPTGNLLSPLPENVITEDTPTPSPNLPIIASDNSSTDSAIETESQSNSTGSTATLPALLTEVRVEDKQVSSNTPILITNNQGHFYIKSKGDGFFIIGSDTASDEDRIIDYQIVTP